MLNRNQVMFDAAKYVSARCKVTYDFMLNVQQANDSLCFGTRFEDSVETMIDRIRTFIEQNINLEIPDTIYYSESTEQWYNDKDNVPQNDVAVHDVSRDEIINFMIGKALHEVVKNPALLYEDEDAAIEDTSSDDTIEDTSSDDTIADTSTDDAIEDTSAA